MEKALRNFLSQESAGGILLLIAVALAMVLANSPLSGLYQGFLDTPMQLRLGALDINKPLLLWINDGLMALFFLLIGLEVKRELLEGALSSVSKASLPTFAAIGGMVVPAAIYLLFNANDPVTQGAGRFRPRLISPLRWGSWHFWVTGFPWRSRCFCWRWQS